MDQSQIDRIDEHISQFCEVVQSSLKHRLQLWGEYDSTRDRAEGLASQMVEIANTVTRVEEHLASLLIVQSYVRLVWDGIVANHIGKPAFSDEKFKSFKEKEYEVISSNEDVSQLKTRLDACVESGKRAVDQLQSLHSVASRAAGIAYGP